MADKFCQFCGGQISEGDVVCPSCGKQLKETVFCKYCGAQIDKHAVICPKCGRQVGEMKQAQTQQPQTQQPQIVINNANTNSNVNTNNNSGGMMYPYKSKVTALLLCIFVGFLGAHRFYVGKIGTGIIWLCTFGLGGIGVIFDLIMIILGSFRDKANMPLQ